jgi:hypothetical protein
MQGLVDAALVVVAVVIPLQLLNLFPEGVHVLNPRVCVAPDWRKPWP